MAAHKGINLKLTKSQIKKYNKIADAGKNPIMVRVGHNWYTWYEGDPKHGVFLTTQSGADVEFDFKQIDDIQESKVMKMKSKLREIIRKELLKEEMVEVERVQDIEASIFDIIIEFKKTLMKSEWKGHRKINSIIRQMLKLEDQLSKETHELA
tara:strand:+ start:314 stop:772 length:459 start_codon:yes stop_codon:yes gene_type:complete